ncbi:Aspartyl aminopeptidase [Phytophthora palmivora]|uniref:aspartyl aminopeptidase n=1 Tax=Phytophthora palmivora TaxID=4796 RepID=A0A2P4YA45_9STRA|nr:Aspartyl aminopeptidase [Phytophthora palmivora]
MVKLSLSSRTPQTVDSFLQFINKSPSPFHAVYETVQALTAAGFKQLREEDSWKDAVQPNGKYYVTRNQSFTESNSTSSTPTLAATPVTPPH